MALTVRPLEPNDRDAVRDLHDRCFDDLAFDEIVIDRLFRHHHAINLVAEREEDDAIVGFASAIHGQRPTARLLTIHTDPSHRGRGIATALMGTLEQRLRARNARQLRLEVHADNEAAIGLYEDRGFTIERKDPTAYPSLDASTGYIMEKDLDA